jgi:hypothetical protein
VRTASRHVLAAALVLLVSAGGVGCGSDGSAGDGDARSTTSGGAASTSDGATPTTDGEAGAASGDVDEVDEDAPPTAAELAAGRGLERLAKAYAPVSARINFLVAAETLRDDAVDGNAGDKIEQERAGVVRIEAERMTDVLAAARPKVAAVPVRTTAQQQVQQLLLEAIDVRSRAMGELLAAIQAQGTGLGDSVVKERFATWNASWDESLRATREATTTTQDARAELGLAPAPEEALR